jgi:hypothetical protein
MLLLLEKLLFLLQCRGVSFIVYGLFDSAVNSLSYIMSNDSMISK